MIVLCWIRGCPSEWKTFVGNRVGEIQTLSRPDEWRHVKSEDNPADMLSRGETPQRLCHSKLWWHGPDWLCFNRDIMENEIQVFKDIPERKLLCGISVSKRFCVSSIVSELLERCSSLERCIRVLAYVMRFLDNARGSPNSRRTDELSPIDLEGALTRIVRSVQIECFPEEYASLSNGRSLASNSKLLSLNPFMYENLIRVGGRLANSKYPFNIQHQIIIPSSHRFTDLLILREHIKLMHSGVQATLFSVRQVYWVLSGRNACKRVIRRCIRCFKVNPRSSDYLMGNLPRERITVAFPSANVGVDYGGPFLLKDRSTRGAKIVKAYLCLFICMSTKAVHLEAVSELTTKAFLATFDRFINRRGKPDNIFSDNGKNFIRANTKLRKLYEFLVNNEKEISNYATRERIKWNFIPPRSPNFGGIWEASIKRAKFHLKHCIGPFSVTFEEFSTILARIEGILNSRPLTPLSCDPNDLQALSPGHFLIGRPITAIPYPDVTQCQVNRLDKFRRLQAISQEFWRRWQREYLPELQVRTKWKQHGSSIINVGKLVLIKDINSPPMSWKLGRVTKLHPGSDGVVRVVDIKTANGQLRRALSQVCVLPLD